jgi:hypothetical protein
VVTLGVAAVVLLGTSLQGAEAADPTITWTGTGDGTTWESALNWDGLRTPGPGDRVRIPNVAATSRVVLRRAATVDSVDASEPLVVADSGALTLSGVAAAAELRNGLLLDNGGAVTGGTVRLPAGTVVLVSVLGRLNGVHVVGDVEVPDNFSWLRVSGGLTVDGVVRLSKGTRLTFSGSQTVAGEARIVMAGAEIAFDDATLTLDSGVLVEGVGAIGGCVVVAECPATTADASRLVNHGTISARPVPGVYLPPVRPAGGLSLSTGLVENQGLLEAHDDIALYVVSRFRNTGTVHLDGGLWRMFSRVTVADLGQWTSERGELILQGGLDNRGTTLHLADGAGVLALEYGTVTGGTLSAAPGGRIELRSGMLEGGVSLAGTTVVPNDINNMQVRGGVSVTGMLRVETQLFFDGSQTIRGPGTVEMRQHYSDDGLVISAGSTLTIASDLTVVGSGRIAGPCQFGSCPGATETLVNRGTLQARALSGDSPSSRIDIDTDRFDNQGRVAAGGRTQSDSIFADGYLMVRPVPDNLSSAGVLTGGRWEVTGSAQLAFLDDGAEVRALDALVSLDGERALFTVGVDDHYVVSDTEAMANLAAVRPSGSLVLAGGRDLGVSGALVNDGRLDLGPGSTITVPGAFSTRSQLNVGLGAGPQVGQVDTGGLATLAGALDVRRVSGFDPGLCDAFTVLAYSGRAGSFATVTGTDMGSGRRLELAYEPGRTVLYVETGRSVSVDDGAAQEGDPVSFAVRLSAPRSRPVDIGYSTADGTAHAGADYQGTSGSLRIPACTTTGAVTVGTTADGTIEGDEHFFLDVQPVDGASTGRGRAIGTITDGPSWEASGPETGGNSGSGSAGPPPPPAPSGYWMLTDAGEVFAFGDAGRHPGAPVGAAKAVDLEPTPSGQGYWVVDDAGVVHRFGDASHHGSLAPRSLARGERVTSLSATRTGHGYWIFTSAGRVHVFGDAVHRGDMSGVALNAPVLDSVRTASGNGYYMVATDGGIFSFGDARFYGSMGGRALRAPVRSLVPDGDGAGYWLVASDGGLFAFDAPFRGSMGGQRLNRPVTGMVRFGNGYLMVGEDGGIFNFSDRPFHGSLGDNPPRRPIVSVAALG